MPTTKRRCYQLLAAEIGLTLLSVLPWVFVLTLPLYIIVATQFFFLDIPLWKRMAGGFGPIGVWVLWLNL